MKTIFALCGLILVAGGVLLWRSLQGPTTFGTFVGAPLVEAQSLIEKPKDYVNRTVSIESEVRKQCTTMGCYFFFQSGDKWLRVDISEIAMNAPRKNGHPARVEGQMVPYQDGYQFWASAVEFR